MDAQQERRAEAIFTELVDVPPADRPARAVVACGGDAALLARVKVLLAALPAADGFLSDPTGIVTIGADPAATPFVVGEKPGDRIGPYKLLEQIGEGGFGVVFMAEQEQPVRRRVALKVIKLGMDTREVVARFEAERQALAMMDHPNIARVLDAGATAAGRPFFVMELVRGWPITEYADGRRLSTRDRVALAAQVCRAVQHAHSKGVIHRDLKPSNVLVTVTDDRPVPKVIDFGIAKATQSRLTDRTLFTAHRQLIGTPQYMSPEQADSGGSDIDTRTDVYSLGVLIYELLVGTTPLDARSLRSAAFEAMRKMIRDADIPRPATRLSTMAAASQSAIAVSRSTDVRKLEASVKGELDWIVMKALEKDRTRRYETAAALADDLNRYLVGEAVLAGPVSGTYRLKKTLKRYRAAVVTGGVIAACLLLGVGGTTWEWMEARHQGAVAVDQQRAASDNARRATDNERRALAGEAKALASADEARRQRRAADARAAESKSIADFLNFDVLVKASPYATHDYQVSKVLVDRLITPALATVDRRFKGQPLIGAAVRDTLARTLNELGRPDRALPQAKAAWDARRAGLGDDHPDTLATMVDYGNALANLGRHAEAADLLGQALARFRRVLGDDDPNTLAAMVDYGNALNGLGRHAEAADVFKQAWDRDRRVRGNDDPATLAAFENYGAALCGLGRTAEAVDVFKQAWDRDRRVLGEDDPKTLAATMNYGSVLCSLGRFAEAADLYKQAWDRDRRVLGDGHPDTLKSMYNYGNVLHGLGRNGEAADLYKWAWDRDRLVLGDDDRETLKAMTSYGNALLTLGRNAEAADVHKQAWDRSRRVLGDDDPDTLMAPLYYGTALNGLGRHAEAADVCKQAWDRDRRVLGADDPVTLAAINNYGAALGGLGRHAESADVFKQAWDRSRRVLGDDHPDTLGAMIDYGIGLNGMGRHAESADVLKQAWDRSRRALGEDHPWTRNARANYAIAMQALGRPAARGPATGPGVAVATTRPARAPVASAATAPATGP